jgi:hypothetical protein
MESKCTCGHDEACHSKKGYGCYNWSKGECKCEQFTPQEEKPKHKLKGRLINKNVVDYIMETENQMTPDFIGDNPKTMSEGTITPLPNQSPQTPRFHSHRENKLKGRKVSEKVVASRIGENRLPDEDTLRGKQFKPKTKEVWRKDATIKIETLLHITKNPKGCFDNKPMVISIIIKKFDGKSISTAFPTTKKGTKELLKFIKEECYLK